MSDSAGRREYLSQLRDELFQEWEAAEQEMLRVRLRVERLESDIRIGRPVTAEYEKLKGHELPGAEARVLELYRDLLKLEDRINLTPK
ncbi:MAG: hypothetical protein ACK47B_18285 [Armatimonadota bacterium]